MGPWNESQYDLLMDRACDDRGAARRQCEGIGSVPAESAQLPWTGIRMGKTVRD